MMYLYKVHLLCDFHTFFCFYFFTHRSLYSVPTLTLLPILPSRTPALSRRRELRVCAGLPLYVC